MPTRKIHIVEDDPDFGAYLSELLEDASCEQLEWNRDGLTGLRRLLEDQPDLVVLDLNLPGLRGEEICRFLRSSSAHRDIRILICSDMPESQRRELELLQIGADYYIGKPFREEEFLGALTKLLDSPRPVAPFETYAEVPTPQAKPGSKVPAPNHEEVSPSPHHRTQGRQSLPLNPNVFQGYRILDVVGGGAMGTVYRALQLNPERTVALKIFLREGNESAASLERFQREAQIMTELDHPHVVRIIGTGSSGFTHYIAMEFMEGGSLMDRIDAAAVDWNLVRAVAAQVPQALGYLHSKGVIHRDIKPGNILLSGDGSTRVGDFGISRSRRHSQAWELTGANTLIGTRVYMAPELLLGHGATEASDQFAVARTILRMFEGEHSRIPRVPLSELRPDLPPALSEALERAMRLDPRDRFADIVEFGEALSRAVEEAPAPGG